ncbi:hypothetical protein ACJW8F_07845 [Plesiomonas shigelloides]
MKRDEGITECAQKPKGGRKWEGNEGNKDASIRNIQQMAHCG